MTSRDSGNRRTTNTRQRKKQQHLLDVKIRAGTERRRRMGRIFSITSKLILTGALCVGAWLGGKEALRRFVWENPDYYLREVNVTTDGSLTRDQILKSSGVIEGSNIFLVNLSKARAAVEKLPQVETVEVTRTLPNKLSISIVERKPVAWVVFRADEDPTASDKSFLIDARGLVMKTRVKLEEYLHFPVISGVATENLVPGEKVNTSEMQAALELIRLTSDSTRFQAQNVDISKGYCLVVTDHNRAKITFGLDRIDAQLTRLHRYLARATEEQKEIQTVNLLVERNTPVTFVEPPAPEPNTALEENMPLKPGESNTKPATTSAGADKTKLATPGQIVKSASTPAAPLATPGTASPKPTNLLSIFKPKATPSATPKSNSKPASGVKKQPFSLH